MREHFRLDPRSLFGQTEKACDEDSSGGRESRELRGGAGRSMDPRLKGGGRLTEPV